MLLNWYDAHLDREIWHEHAHEAQTIANFLYFLIIIHMCLIINSAQQ